MDSRLAERVTVLHAVDHRAAVVDDLQPAVGADDDDDLVRQASFLVGAATRQTETGCWSWRRLTRKQRHWRDGTDVRWEESQLSLAVPTYVVARALRQRFRASRHSSVLACQSGCYGRGWLCSQFCKEVGGEGTHSLLVLDTQPLTRLGISDVSRIQPAQYPLPMRQGCLGALTLLRADTRAVYAVERGKVVLVECGRRLCRDLRIRCRACRGTLRLRGRAESRKIRGIERRLIEVHPL
jgi:hypothetical protein